MKRIYFLIYISLFSLSAFSAVPPVACSPEAQGLFDLLYETKLSIQIDPIQFEKFPMLSYGHFIPPQDRSATALDQRHSPALLYSSFIQKSFILTSGETLEQYFIRRIKEVEGLDQFIKAHSIVNPIAFLQKAIELNSLGALCTPQESLKSILEKVHAYMLKQKELLKSSSVESHLRKLSSSSYLYWGACTAKYYMSQFPRVFGQVRLFPSVGLFAQMQLPIFDRHDVLLEKSKALPSDQTLISIIEQIKSKSASDDLFRSFFKFEANATDITSSKKIKVQDSSFVTFDRSNIVDLKQLADNIILNIFDKLENPSEEYLTQLQKKIMLGLLVHTQTHLEHITNFIKVQLKGSGKDLFINLSGLPQESYLDEMHIQFDFETEQLQIISSDHRKVEILNPAAGKKESLRNIRIKRAIVFDLKQDVRSDLLISLEEI